MSELKSRLPGKTKKQDLEAFLAGAETRANITEIEAETSASVEPAKSKKANTSPQAKQIAKPIYPWEAAGIRDDVLKVYNLRLPEAYLLKLKYIAEHTPDSMQKFCLQVLQEAIDQKIAELVK